MREPTVPPSERIQPNAEELPYRLLQGRFGIPGCVDGGGRSGVDILFESVDSLRVAEQKQF